MRLLEGFVHGAAEMLPVSSSGHAALVGAREDPVALHAGSLAAVLIAFRREGVEALRHLDARRAGMHLAAGSIPAALGFVLERRGWPRGDLGLGMAAGAALLACGDLRRGTRSRWDAGVADGLWLGVAQASALWSGVSRNGATLAVARLRGFAPEEANRLSREVGVPVTAGAVALRRPPVGVAVVTSFVGAFAALPLVRVVDRGGPLWPWAAERAVVALVLLRESRG
jgi:undecaprenyl-diphosphatase